MHLSGAMNTRQAALCASILGLLYSGDVDAAELQISQFSPSRQSLSLRFTEVTRVKFETREPRTASIPASPAAIPIENGLPLKTMMFMATRVSRVGYSYRGLKVSPILDPSVLGAELRLRF